MPPPGSLAAAPELVAMDCNIGIKGEGFEYIFGRGKGLVSIRYNGVRHCWTIPCALTSGARPLTTAKPADTTRSTGWKSAGLHAFQVLQWC